MENVLPEKRNFDRIQLGNSHLLEFSLLDGFKDQLTSYCICTDLSEAGAHFFTDREYAPNQELQLTIRKNGQVMEKQTVSVIRGDKSLDDEERFCHVVVFDQPLACFAEIAAIAAIKPGNSGTIAA